MEAHQIIFIVISGALSILNLIFSIVKMDSIHFNAFLGWASASAWAFFN